MKIKTNGASKSCQPFMTLGTKAAILNLVCITNLFKWNYVLTVTVWKYSWNKSINNDDNTQRPQDNLNKTFAPVNYTFTGRMGLL